MRNVSRPSNPPLSPVNADTLVVQTTSQLGSNNATSSTAVLGNASVECNNTTTALRVTQLGAGDALLVQDSSNPDSTPFVIDKDGNVGIGLTAPAYPLHISQGGSAPPYSATDRLVVQATSNAAIQIVGANNGQSGLMLSDPDNRAVGGFVYDHADNSLSVLGNTQTRMFVKSDGKVHIGGTDPQALLDVEGVIAANAGTASAPAYTNNDDTNTGVFFGGADTLGFATGGVERGRINANGYHKFSNDGTYESATGSYHEFRGASASGTLFVTSMAAGTNDINVALKFNAASDLTTTAKHITANTGGTQVFTVAGNGNVQNLNNSYGSISDKSLKKHIKETGAKLAKLMRVRIVNYVLKDDPAETKQLGVIAQELEKVFPGLVDTDPDTKLKSVKYSVFVPILIKSLQELGEKVERLEKELATIKSK